MHLKTSLVRQLIFLKSCCSRRLRGGSQLHKPCTINGLQRVLNSYMYMAKTKSFQLLSSSRRSQSCRRLLCALYLHSL